MSEWDSSTLKILSTSKGFNYELFFLLQKYIEDLA
jgi:hypothetical protein